MKKINDCFPVYLIENFYHLNHIQKFFIIKKILKESCKKSSFTSLNYPIFTWDKNSFFSKLYDRFYKKCSDIFLFTLSQRNKKICWCYVNNINFFETSIHNHLNSATINSVFYLNIPNKTSGGIEFYLNNKILKYQPKNFDLLIFPSYLNHKPLQSQSKNWRISINMEIQLEEKSEDVFRLI